MGGSNEKVQISLSLETPSVSAGADAVSLIHLVVKDDCKVSQLALRFYGKERAYRDKLRVEAIQIPAHIWESGVLERGHYIFPVMLDVPPHIPSSFEAENYSIKYFLEAVLLSRKGGVLVSDKKELVVNQEVIVVPGEYVTERCYPVSGCCFRRGALTVTVRTDKFAYMPHEAPAVSVSIDNSRGVATITQVSCSLTQVIVNRKGKKSQVSHLTVVSKRIIIGKERMRDDLRFDMPLYASFDQIHTAGTTRGTLFECKYVLSFLVELGMCTNSVIFETPIHVYTHEREAPPLPEAPADWHPIEMPMSRLSYQTGIQFQPSAPVLEDE